MDWSAVDFRWFGGFLIAIGLVLIIGWIWEAFFLPCDDEDDIIVEDYGVAFDADSHPDNLYDEHGKLKQ